MDETSTILMIIGIVLGLILFLLFAAYELRRYVLKAEIDDDDEDIKQNQ